MRAVGQEPTYKLLPNLLVERLVSDLSCHRLRNNQSSLRAKSYTSRRRLELDEKGADCQFKQRRDGNASHRG